MDHVIIDGEKYSATDLKTLTGKREHGSPEKHVLLLAKILKDPLNLPYLLKDICSIELNDEERRDLRLALIRVQIDSDLRMNEDIQKYQQRRYVAQVIEILLFKELLLEPGEPEEID